MGLASTGKGSVIQLVFTNESNIIEEMSINESRGIKKDSDSTDTLVKFDIVNVTNIRSKKINSRSRIAKSKNLI